MQYTLYCSFQKYKNEKMTSFFTNNNMSQCMRLPTMWYVQPANSQISLRIHAVWSEPLLVAWVYYDCKATDWTPFGVSKLKRRLQSLVRVYTCQNATLLEISFTGYFSKIHADTEQQSHVEMIDTDIGIVYLSRDMWFPTMRHFDKCRLRRACAVPF